MADLQAGDSAPDFSGKNQNGETISLGDYTGKTVVLYFYPKDDTPGCTKEACGFRDNIQVLTDKDVVIIGVSADDEAKHQKFIDKYELPFDLIADTDKSICEAYGAWGEKKNYGKTYMGIIRKTFVIGPDGKIVKAYHKVQAAAHPAQIVELLCN